MSDDYDHSQITKLDLELPRIEGMLASPASTWTTEDWAYAVFCADDLSSKTGRKILEKLANEHPKEQLMTVLEYWAVVEASIDRN